MIRTAALSPLSFNTIIPLMSALTWRIHGRQYAWIPQCTNSTVTGAEGPPILGRTSCGNFICFRCSAASRNIEGDELSSVVIPVSLPAFTFTFEESRPMTTGNLKCFRIEGWPEGHPHLTKIDGYPFGYVTPLNPNPLLDKNRDGYA